MYYNNNNKLKAINEFTLYTSARVFICNASHRVRTTMAFFSVCVCDSNFQVYIKMYAMWEKSSNIFSVRDMPNYILHKL